MSETLDEALAEVVRMHMMRLTTDVTEVNIVAPTVVIGLRDVMSEFMVAGQLREFRRG